MEKPDHSGKSYVEFLGFLNLSAIISDAAAKTVSMAVLFGAKEQTPWYPSRFGLLAMASNHDEKVYEISC